MRRARRTYLKPSLVTFHTPNADGIVPLAALAVAPGAIASVSTVASAAVGLVVGAVATTAALKATGGISQFTRKSLTLEPIR